MKKYFVEYTDSFTEFENKSIQDLILYNCGIEYCQPNYSYGPKRRAYHFIHFVKEGKGQLKIDGKTYSIQQDQFFIVPAGSVSTYSADAKEPWKYSWIGFLGIRSDHYIQQLLSQNKFVFDCADAKLYEDQIKSVLALSENDLASFLKITGVLYTMLGQLIAEAGTKKAQLDPHSLVGLAIHFMELHYHDALLISNVADFVGVHQNYLSARFKQELGVSPKRFLIDLKLRKAKEMLLQTADPINIIASSVGFSDSLSFSKFFKKYTGYAPTAYRKEFS